ncbi:ATPase-like protein [Xylariaceae sp. FL0662B]|nr:ATPase-like protein [Xylariaceae sp. FL0662B]
MFSTCIDDNNFGPGVRGCRDDFDFTINFESIILTLLPNCLFIAVSVLRIACLLHRQHIVHSVLLRNTKLAATSIFAILQVVLLALSIRSARPRLLLAPSLAVSFASALGIVLLSLLEHSRTPRPSILLNTYLFVTVLFDIARTRTFFLASSGNADIIFCRLFTASVAFKGVLIALESYHKTKCLEWNSKRHSPEETAGIFGLATFFWLNSLFLTGYKNILKLDNLYPLSQILNTDTLSLDFERLVKEAPNKGQRFSIIKALGKTLATSLILPIAPRAMLTAFKFSQPFFINTLLDYMQHGADNSPKNLGYGLIGAAILIYGGIAASTALYWYFHERTLALIRGCLVGAVYRMTTEMKLSSDAAALTLMSTDIERIRLGILNLHEFWANSIEVGLASWLLYRQVGAAFAAPLVVVLCCVFGGAFLNKFTGRRTKAWMDKVQQRVRLTANVISNMKHLKLSGLTTPVRHLIQAMRVDELETASRYRRIHISVVTLGIAPTALCPVFLFALTSRTLDVTTIFTSLSYILLIADPLSYLFMNSPALLSAIACLTRIQAYLEQDPRIDYRISKAKSSRISTEGASSSSDDLDPGSHAAAITITDGNFGWNDEGNFVLKDINLKIPYNKLTIVVGPVASGKTTLCKALLGEIPVFQGAISMESRRVSRRVAYCDQVSFLWSASIRKNIIGFAPFNQARYKEVIDAAMLGADITNFPKGDETEVGSDGIKLSGGQKQRVSIARALYLDTDFLIFDDVLSGLDNSLGEQVFRRVFGPAGLLRRRGATVVLCTHTVQHLASADHIIALGANGTMVEQGSYQNLMANNSYVHGLDIRPVEVSEPTENMTIIKEDRLRETEFQELVPAEILDHSHLEERDRMMGDSTVYRHYIASVGKFSACACVFLGLGYGFFYNWGQVWLKFWSEGSRSNGFYIGLYALFQCCFLLFLFFDFLVCYTTMIQTSGSSLHEASLDTVLKAPLKFFTKTDTGSITNLFSQDMTLIDNELPIALANLVMDSANALGMAAVIATSSPYLAATYPVIFSILYFIQKFNLRTSRQLRLLDLEAKSPLYSHFLDTIKGLATFRAFGWVPSGIEFNQRLLETSQRPYYLLYIVQRWLLFVLQIIVALLALVVTTLATQLRGNTALTGASLVTLMTFGDVLNYIIRWWTQLETSISAVSRLKNFSEKIKPEDQIGEDVVPPPEWPLRGTIHINGVSASYDDDNTEISEKCPPEGGAINFALKDLQLSIQAGEKVAICGRSGSGKSSTIALLMRLLDPLPSCSHNITIDDTPLHEIDRTTLRQRVIAVPQEPVFLPDGTPYMENLDPYHLSSEDDCRSVLEAVGLWRFVGEKGGLGAGMAADSLSQGQKQLFSLARAILRRRIRTRQQQEASLGHATTGEKRNSAGILLLDEVSSSVDQDTDRAMQRLVLEEFEGYTIVMVSHRLEMVMAFDTVVMMDRGSIVEAGPPRELVARERSRFRDLWLVRNQG